MGEKALIQRLAALLPSDHAELELGIGDDAAIVDAGGPNELVVSTDTLNSGIHFDEDVDPESLGHKALAVNLSDLAAMGAVPRWALLNLSLPSADPHWLDRFSRGFAALARAHQVCVIGGDTCRGPRSITVTVLGECEPGTALRRSGAQPDDRVWLSGVVGSAGLGLQQRQAGRNLSRDLREALDRPSPRVELGQALRSMASACIDVSDGVLNDLGHIVSASGVGAMLELQRLPAGESVAELPDADRWALQLTAGEDYELCFTAPDHHSDAIFALGEALQLPLTCVGRTHAGSGVMCQAPDGSPFEPASDGWDHFGETGEGASP